MSKRGWMGFDARAAFVLQPRDYGVPGKIVILELDFSAF
jgi:hypothetical protein